MQGHFLWIVLSVAVIAAEYKAEACAIGETILNVPPVVGRKIKSVDCHGKSFTTFKASDIKLSEHARSKSWIL